MNKNQLFREKGLTDQLKGLWKTNRRCYYLVALWAILGVISDWGFSVIGFYTIGIEYEKNPLIVEHWLNGTFFSDLIPLLLTARLLLIYILVFCFIIDDLLYYKKAKYLRHINIIFFAMLPSFIFALHHTQGFLWCYAIIFRPSLNPIIILLSIIYAGGTYILLTHYVSKYSKNPFPDNVIEPMRDCDKNVI